MKLAIFPINLVSFPEESVPLHIFEPRYRQLIHECDENGIHFGLLTKLNNQISIFGTEMKLEKITKMHLDGRMDVIVKGLRVFKLNVFYKIFPDRLYPGGEVEFINTDSLYSAKGNLKLETYFCEISKLLGIKYDFLDTNVSNLSYKIAHHIGLSIKQKIRLLSMKSEAERQDMIQKYFDKIIPILKTVIKTSHDRGK